MGNVLPRPRHGGVCYRPENASTEFWIISDRTAATADFGSYARGEAQPGSDLDIACEFTGVDEMDDDTHGTTIIPHRDFI